MISTCCLFVLLLIVKWWWLIIPLLILMMWTAFITLLDNDTATQQPQEEKDDESLSSYWIGYASDVKYLLGLYFDKGYDTWRIVEIRNNIIYPDMFDDKHKAIDWIYKNFVNVSGVRIYNNY